MYIVHNNVAVYLFSLSLSVSLPSYVSHSYSISLTLPSSSQSGAPHLHISLALSLHFLFLSAALALFASSFLSLSPDVPRLFPIFCLPTTLLSPSSLLLFSLSPFVHAPSLNPLSPFISLFPSLPSLTLQSPSVRMCG